MADKKATITVAGVDYNLTGVISSISTAPVFYIGNFDELNFEGVSDKINDPEHVAQRQVEVKNWSGNPDKLGIVVTKISGKYVVLFGHQQVTELINDVTAEAFEVKFVSPMAMKKSRIDRSNEVQNKSYR